jgi:hypothetical protein
MPLEPKNEIWGPNQYGRVMWSIDRKISRKIYFVAQKVENKLSEPKNGIWGPKSI